MREEERNNENKYYHKKRSEIKWDEKNWKTGERDRDDVKIGENEEK